MMITKIAFFFVFLLLGRLTLGLSIPGVSRAERVFRSETIVIASVRDRSAHACKLAVSKTLFGPNHNEIHLNDEPGYFENGLVGVFFLVKRGQHFQEVLPNAYAPIEDLDNIVQVIDMRTSPGKYFADARFASDSEFFEMLGLLLRDKGTVAGIPRKAAVDYLCASLKLPGRYNILAAMKALREVESKSSLAVIPLLRHSDPVVRLNAAHFLTWAPHREAVAPLSQLLDEIDGSDPNGTKITML